jgi:anthranilate synthase/aminodeoxychorismate synthase-like glutamine amidotransferase|tara:strand:+ start:498 stop:1076 length:579 start_codon:yes stop_codon:yes gene_type:complete
MLLLIDNYDSFTFNLFQYFAELGETVEVFRNDQLSVAEALDIAPDHVVISPGPCTPIEAGISVDIITAFSGISPILGVCLGHQSIAQAFGGEVGPAGEIMHGKVSKITHDGEYIYSGIPDEFAAIRYHSLAVKQESLPEELVVTSRSESGVIMGIRHQEFAIEGVQFHPESIMTEHGRDLLANFVELRSATW